MQSNLFVISGPSGVGKGSIIDQISKKLHLAHKKYFNTIITQKLNPLELCLNYAFSQKKLNYLLVGCDNINQLKQLLNTSADIKGKNYYYYQKLFDMPDAHEINF